MELYLIAGLGNPGREYKETRHNIGRRVIRLIARQSGITLDSRRFRSRNGLGKIHGHECILLCPMIFMNLSGRAIKKCVDYFNLDMERILIIHDDLDLPVGRVKVVKQGGAAGHRGIQSIIDYLGRKDFARIKIGIGRPQCGETIEQYVLNPFYDDEKDIIFEVTGMAVQACRLVVCFGVEFAMNQINHQNLGFKEVKN
ncbi:MAG: aminoacyl-tRNA hydrolase [Deltaproteobacteria bacterium]|nr:aminoacyl-tRNA hydrolase [Deltaproteobacteria bacterium]